MALQAVQELKSLHPDQPVATHRVLWVLGCVLLALVQAPWAGYQLGVGNQGIQAPFLLTLHDNGLFARDVMVQGTLPAYPSLFFAAVAPLLHWFDLPTLYLGLHLLTGVAVFITTALLVRSMFADHWAPLLALLLLVAGHQHALAGETLYSAGFTHTWATFPLAILALAFFYHQRTWAAFALVGLIFNFHALEAAYLAAVMGAWAMLSIRRLGVLHVLGLFAVLAITASPTVWMMLSNSQTFEGQWLTLMQVRSADHSFPASWWQAGDPAVPRFLIVLALAGLSLSFRALPGTQGTAHKTLIVAGVMGAMFIVGFLFTEVWPVPVVIRAQLFRGSRFLLVIALAHIAYGAVRAWRLPWSADYGGGEGSGLMRWVIWLEFASATFTVLCLAMPPMLVLLPWALALTTITAFLNARLTWAQAILAGVALWVSLAAWRQIHFVIPGISQDFNWQSLADWRGPGAVGGLVLIGAVALWFLARRSISFPAKIVLGPLIILTCGLMTATVWARLAATPTTDPNWSEVQLWARDHSPNNALFLTPIQPGGFRTQSQRAVVAEWRDGTQLYFAADFAEPWWQRVNELAPGMTIAPDGRRLLVQGQPLEQMDDASLIALAKRYGATHIVLPASSPRKLSRLFFNPRWAVYEAAYPPPPPPEDLAGAQVHFLRDVVMPNIERHRKRDARLQVLDTQGRPASNATYHLRQVDSAFRFGATLPPFVASPPGQGVTGRVVTEAERQRFGELFNHTVTGTTGWWMSIAPAPDVRWYDDLDALVAWAVDRGVSVEFSFVAGFNPPWAAEHSDKDRRPLLEAHARQLVERYADRIDMWHLTDLSIALDVVPQLAQIIGQGSDSEQIGLSDAARFGSSQTDTAERTNEMLRGLAAIGALQKKNVKLDFVALHGRQPWGLWPDARAMYLVFDTLAQKGVRLHVTQVAVPDRGPIEGGVRQGDWTPELQAEFYRTFFTVAFSHPAVDVINLAGLSDDTRLPGAGVLNAAGEPKPAFDALKDLLTRQWRTDASGPMPLDGVIAFRGFHGNYQLELTLPDGQKIVAPFALVGDDADASQPASLRFTLDRAAATLQISPSTSAISE